MNLPSPAPDHGDFRLPTRITRDRLARYPHLRPHPLAVSACTCDSSSPEKRPWPGGHLVQDPGGGGGRDETGNHVDTRHAETSPDWQTLRNIILCITATLAVATSSYALGRTHAPDARQPRHLRRRQDGAAPACASSGGGARAAYDLPLHIGAIFIVFAVSGSACVFPLLAVRFPKMRVPATFLFAVQHFGTGVLLATAFVHLLPTAFTSLLDPCLGTFWTTTYPAMAGAIALVGIFVVAVIEMVFSPGRHLCRGPTMAMFMVPDLQHHHPEATTPPQRDCNAGQPFRSRHLVGGRSTSIGRGLTRTEMENRRLEMVDHQTSVATNVKAANASAPASASDDNGSPPLAAASPTSEQQRKKAVMQCTLLEIGILFHSVFIGMSLSVTTGSDFIVLLIAIIFHQSCEGLALGARISHIHWGPRAVRPWLMALAYGCTTPLGQALGIATHRLYDPASAAGLLVVGIFNAISAGFLAFSSLVELLSEDFLSDESWRVLRGRRRYAAFALMVLGAVGMSLIGAWA